MDFGLWAFGFATQTFFLAVKPYKSKPALDFPPTTRQDSRDHELKPGSGLLWGLGVKVAIGFGSRVLGL